LLRCYQRGGFDVEVSSIFQTQLIWSRTQLPDIISRWIKFAKSGSPPLSEIKQASRM
jgi:hypothetical protein